MLSRLGLFLGAMAQSPQQPTTPAGDAIFQEVERMRAAQRGVGSWGTVLDAGTGAHSLRWIQRLPADRWTAVTADEAMRRTVQDALDTTTAAAAAAAASSSSSSSSSPPEEEGGEDPAARPFVPGDIVLGNWEDQELLRDQQFDVVLADYLIGAMDGFSPFKQDLIFDRLKSHLAPGGILFIVGLQPIPYEAPFPESIVLEVTRMRDACIQLAGHRCYREYPLDWILRHLEKSGFRVLESKRLPILYSEHTLRRQLNVARRKLGFFADKNLAAAMTRAIDALDNRMVAALQTVPGQRLRHGFDYIVAAEVADFNSGKPRPESLIRPGEIPGGRSSAAASSGESAASSGAENPSS